jgi:hypothetical protein
MFQRLERRVGERDAFPSLRERSFAELQTPTEFRRQDKVQA